MSIDFPSRIRLAARPSDLSRVQVYSVARALRERHPSLEVELVLRKSEGDTDRLTALVDFANKGAFTKDLSLLLERGEVDAVVHSWKDLPTEELPCSQVVATLPRADARDVILVHRRAFETRDLRILTSAPRREFALRKFLPEALPTPSWTLSFRPVRGNIPTRIRKLINDEGNALVLAKAALDRLLTSKEAEFADCQQLIRDCLKHCAWMVLPQSACPCAPAQGAVAIEVSRTRSDIASLFQTINSAADFSAVQLERKDLQAAGGGCHQKLGIAYLPRPYGTVHSVHGEMPDGTLCRSFKVLRSGATKKVATEKLFPQPDEKFGFSRKRIAFSIPSETSAIWVTRAEALPDQYEIDPATILWTAGTASWTKLAQRGYWVHGCADSLGEEELPNLELLAGKSLTWAKLSHTKAPQRKGLPLVATYELSEPIQLPDLSKRTHFFWMSGSLCAAALQRHPEIGSRIHACGPGNSLQEIRELLRPYGNEPMVFLSREEFYQHFFTE